jgi:phytoene desaturase
MPSALVIGAGVGGLATAGRLARAGFQVTVLEKTDRPGGRFSVIRRDGFSFDTGPTLLLMPEYYRETYAALGERLEDHLDLERLSPNYRVHFDDGTVIDLNSDVHRMHGELERLAPGAFGSYLRFLEEGHRHYTISLDRFVGRNFRSWAEFLSPGNLPLLFRLKALRTHAANTAGYFQDPRLLAAFTFQNMYLGVSPYDAMATYSLLQATELIDGIWFPRGGMYRVIETLSEIIKGLGVMLRTNAPVARIDVEGSRATGVTLEDGERLTGDVVVANADLPYVYTELLPDDGTAVRLNRLRYTSSALMFYWGVRGERTDRLLHHNVFLSARLYRESFDRIFRDLTLPDSPSFYVRCASRTDPGMAPQGMDAYFVLVPVGHLSEGKVQDWGALRARARSEVLRRLAEAGLPGLESRIAFEERIGPEDYRQRWNLAKGSAFGLSHNFLQVGYFRPHNRHARYRNLYFAGASTHPGTGVPLVMISARLVVERVLRDMAMAPAKAAVPT